MDCRFPRRPQLRSVQLGKGGGPVPPRQDEEEKSQSESIVMRPHFSERFTTSYSAAPAEIQRAFDRKLALLLANLRHPSLHAKKYDEARDVWQARASRGWRFYF